MQKRPQWNMLGALLALLVTTVILMPSALAQTTSATLRGVIKDPSGAVVPKANVTLISDRTKAERKTTTTNDGTYVFTTTLFFRLPIMSKLSMATVSASGTTGCLT